MSVLIKSSSICIFMKGSFIQVYQKFKLLFSSGLSKQASRLVHLNFRFDIILGVKGQLISTFRCKTDFLCESIWQVKTYVWMSNLALFFSPSYRKMILI